MSWFSYAKVAKARSVLDEFERESGMRTQLRNLSLNSTRLGRVFKII